MEEPADRLALIDQETWLNDHGLISAEAAHDETTAGEREDEIRVRREEQYANQVMRGMLKEDFPEAVRTCEVEIPEGRFVTFVAQDQQTVSNVSLRLACQECEYIAMITQSAGNWTVDENGNLSITVGDYPVESIQAFVGLMQANGEESTSSIDPSISGETLVDMCRIAHFLCAERIVRVIHDELVACVDSSSCLPLCQLAEDLNLPRLMEASLARMMDSLDNDAILDDLNADLCERIHQIKGAINSSLNSGSRLFFGSMEEYIAIFAERVSYLEERLLEAREQFAMAEADMSVFGRNDAHQKISRQAKRVKTLQTALNEQRKVLLSKPGDIKRPASLEKNI